MAFNKKHGMPVGADLSAFRGVHNIPHILLKFINVPLRVFHSNNSLNPLCKAYNRKIKYPSGKCKIYV
jgi:hypothetical protein